MDYKWAIFFPVGEKLPYHLIIVIEIMIQNLSPIIGVGFKISFIYNDKLLTKIISNHSSHDYFALKNRIKFFTNSPILRNGYKWLVQITQNFIQKGGI